MSGKKNAEGVRKAWRYVMKAKRGLIVCAAVMMMVLLTGCGGDAETEEEIITIKEEDGSGEESLPAEDLEGQVQSTEEGTLGGIAQQVQAPEHYTADFASGDIQVKADAQVVIPDGEGFKTYRVKARAFEQADYDTVSHVILKDEKLWERDEEAMAESHGLTREEIEKTIANREEEIEKAKALGAKAVKHYEAEVGKELVVVEEELAVLRELLVDAPEEAVIIEVPAVVTVNTGSGGEQNNEEKKEAGWLNGYATVDGKDFAVSVDNMFTEDWRWNNFQVIKKWEEKGYFASYYSFSGLSEAQKENASLSTDNIKMDAAEKVAAMGFTDFVPAGEEYYAIYGNEEEYFSIQDAVQDIAYGIHFTRTFDGVPVTYTSEMGTTLENGDNLVWPYENMTLVYNKDGLVNFIWENPYEVEKVSDEYLFLLPFSEIQNTFEEMIIKKYQDWINGTGMKMDFQINEVRLGYMRVREDGNAEEGTMIPVWDFIGSRGITYEGEETAYDASSVFQSWITINALDGTIISRELGY